MTRSLLPLATVLAMAAFSPVGEITRTFKKLMETLASAQRIFAIKDQPITVSDSPEIPGLSTHHGAPPSVKFENTSFAYRPDEPLVLRGVSLRIEPWQTVAFVVPSGS